MTGTSTRREFLRTTLRNASAAAGLFLLPAGVACDPESETKEPAKAPSVPAKPRVVRVNWTTHYPP